MEGIRSKENVQQYGEVFTPDSIVNDMLKLVDDALREEGVSPQEYLDKTYLEPACGDGNFLIRILDRKLAVIKQYIPQSEWRLALVKAVSTIYGVDIQMDNAVKSRKRMLQLMKTGTADTFDLPNKEIKPFTHLEVHFDAEYEKVIQSILDKNIIYGNTLEKDDTSTMSVVLTEYKFSGEMVTMQEFRLNRLEEPLGDATTVHYMKMFNVEKDNGIMDEIDDF